MQTLRRIAPALALSLTLGFATAACGTTTSTPSGTDAMTKSADMPSATGTTATSTGSAAAAPMAPGAYLTQAAYTDQMAAREGTTVVYFFHAPWCPDCRTTDTSLTTDGVPEGLTVVKIDYDSATDLKKKFGVTQQHTFVVLDGSGNAVKKFTGATTGAAIKAEAA